MAEGNKVDIGVGIGVEIEEEIVDTAEESLEIFAEGVPQVEDYYYPVRIVLLPVWLPTKRMEQLLHIYIMMLYFLFN